jgi:hypothetical protein
MFVIKNNKTGTYYKCDTPIGPSMGATFETAHRFGTKQEATQKMASHSFAFGFCAVVSAFGEKKAIRKSVTRKA